MIGGFRVPLLFYIPGLGRPLPHESDRVTQHSDVVPSILGLLGIDKPDRLLTGHSVFDVGTPGFAFNYTTASYWYIDNKILLNNMLKIKHG